MGYAHRRDALSLPIVGSLVSHDGVHIMCASCGFVDGVSKEEYEAMGLFSEHCYSILNVQSP